MKIYLAGKIEKNCWRHGIVRGLRNAVVPMGAWPILAGAALVDYVGPYFVGCDHGCYHGPGCHGMLGPLDIDEELESGAVIYGPDRVDCVGDGGDGRTEEGVFNACLAAVDRQGRTIRIVRGDIDALLRPKRGKRK